MDRLTPFLWLLFSAGGTIAAMFFPIHLFLTGIAIPLGWLEAPRYEPLYQLFSHPIVRLYLLAFTGTRWLGAVTPLGGLCFLAGWVALALAGRAAVAG